MDNTTNRKENKMGIMPVNRLLVTMSLPIMVSMLIQATYNIVDSVFVSWISEDALTAVSLAFPIQTLMIAVGVGTGVGINSILSRRLGEKRYDDANKTAENGIFLAILSWVLFAVFGLFFSETFINAFTTDAEIIAMGTDYVYICTVFSFGVFIQIAAERIMQSTGNTIYNMVIQGCGAVINIILDPILIFGWFGAPQLGVRGAAIATVIGQFVAMTLGIILNIKVNKEISIKLRGFRPSLRIIKDIYRVGFPSIIMQSLSAVMTFGLNKILLLYTETAVSVVGIYFKLQSFVFMPVFGLNSAMIPIIAYNYGAKNKERINKTIRHTLTLSLLIMALGTLGFQFLAKDILKIFKASDEMMRIGVPALRIISSCFPIAGIVIVFSSFFQAIGNGIYSMSMSLTRQIFVILPAAFILAKFVSLNSIWFAFPISEFVTLTLCIFMFRHIYKKLIKPL